MRLDQTTQVVNEVISLLIQAAPSGWKRIFLGFETLDGEEQLATSSIAIAVMKPLFGKAVRRDMRLPEKVRDLMVEVALHFMQRANQKHITLDLLVWNNGKFRTYIDYEPLERLGPELQPPPRYRRYGNDDPLLKDL